MTRSLLASVPDARSSACGESASSNNAYEASRIATDPVAPGSFPPELVVRVKAIACELPATLGVPLSRWSPSELGSHVRGSGLVAAVSDTTIWRWLNEDAIRPWQHRCWIFPRDPDFAEKAGRILGLYHQLWKGRRLRADEFVICADEKTSIQTRARKHPSLPTQPVCPWKSSTNTSGSESGLTSPPSMSIASESLVAVNARTVSRLSMRWSHRP